MFGWKWKREEIEKVSLYKFTYILLLKNDAQLKLKKKNQLPKFIKKNKNHVLKKKSQLNQKRKIKAKESKKKKKKRKEYEHWTSLPGKKIKSRRKHKKKAKEYEHWTRTSLPSKKE